MKQMEAILIVMKWAFALGSITFWAFAVERLIHPTPYNEASDCPFILTMLGMSFACLVLHVLCENGIIEVNNEEITIE